MVRGLLIGAVLLAASPAFAQTPPQDPDAPRATGPRSDVQPKADPSTPLTPPQARRPEEAPTVTAEQPDAGPRPRGQLFISPAGEPFRAPFGQPYPVQAWFDGADTNHDGALTLDEFKADAMRFFKVLDADHDGVIDGFENDDYENKLVPEILPKVGGLTAIDVMTRKELMEGKAGRGAGRGGSGFGRGGGRGGDQRRGAGQFGLLDEPQPVRGSDKDLNYKVTPQEWEAAAAHRFAELDKNHDGRIEKSELSETPLQTMIARREKQDAKRRK